jgi:alkanesulfonate monooxygenase
MTGRSLEVAWFAALCDDDADVIGDPARAHLSSFEHCSAIALEAERQGFDSILLPSGYELGIDNTVFAAGIATMTSRIRLLLAIRTGELWPPQLARQLASLDQMSGGRLDVNAISSPLPGEALDSAARYRRTAEVLGVLDDLLEGRDAKVGEAVVGPPRIARTIGRRPPYYFGGLSDEAREVAASIADVYLMWPDRLDRVASVVDDLRHRASSHGRQLRFGYRIHVVVRSTESEARSAARALVASIDDAEGAVIRSKALDSGSVGVARQAELRDLADDEGYVDGVVFTGIGRARSGCGAAVVGSPEQIVAYLSQLVDLGMESVILSGYPHRDECRRFGEMVLPLLDHGPLTIR